MKKISSGRTPDLGNFLNLLKFLFSKFEIENLQILKHPFLLESLCNNTCTLFVYPSQSNLYYKLINYKSLNNIFETCIYIQTCAVVLFLEAAIRLRSGFSIIVLHPQKVPYDPNGEYAFI